jgi:hypothetical protein
MNSCWDITQRRMVIIYWRFGKVIGPIFKSQNFLDFEDGTDTLSRNVGKGLPLDAA